MSWPSLTRAERIEALVVRLRALCALDEANTVEREFAEMEAEWDEAVAEADRLNTITGEQGERIACLDTALATAREQADDLRALHEPAEVAARHAVEVEAARVEGVRLGLEAGNDECKRRAREEAQRAFERQGNDDAVFAHEQRQGALSDCGRSIRAMDPAVIAKGGTRE